MNALRLLALPALTDNYIWLLADAAGAAVVVDPGAEAPVREACARDALQLKAILLTHHHPDHVGAAVALAQSTGAIVYAPVDARIDHADVRVREGDVVELTAPALRLEIMETPGHTASHVAYVGEGLLFCGDTLFSIGCGRLFEGTPAQMLASLDRLAMLPGTTQVCCGHEYTVANCAFARTLDPHNAALRARANAADGLRAKSLPTLPALMSEERACNPFLRIDSPALVAAIDADHELDRIARFAELRRRKDHFRMPAQ